MPPLYLTTAYFRTYVQEIQKQYKKTRCEVTGTTKCLTVHHLTAYTELLKQAFFLAGVPYKKKIIDISLEDREKVISALHKLHNKDNVVTVTRTQHELYHRTYQEINLETWQLFIALRKQKTQRGMNGRCKNL